MQINRCLEINFLVSLLGYWYWDLRIKFLILHHQTEWPLCMEHSNKHVVHVVHQLQPKSLFYFLEWFSFN